MMVYHPVDFDIDDFLSRIQGNKPPFMCPAETCGKVYKSYAHMQKHMLIHRPPEPIEIPAPPIDMSQTLDDLSLKGFFKSHSLQPQSTPSINGENLTLRKSMNSLVPSDSRCSVVFEATQTTRGQTFRCSIFVPLTLRIQSSTKCDVLCQNQIPNPSVLGFGDGVHCTESERKVSHVKNKSKMRNGVLKMNYRDEKAVSEPAVFKKNTSTSLDQNHSEEHPTPCSEIRLPKPVFEVDTDFVFKKPVPLKEGHGYIRFIEKSPDELDDIVEYDLDEEDLFWLERINRERRAKSLSPVAESVLEWIMDRFEKEAKFRLISSSGTGPSVDTCIAPAIGQSGIDEDAVCAVCQDGTCENTNMILFCDVCNLAVHQECYGVPYVPEGPWLCRKCLHSPSEPVSCVLCPNRGGAFKKTSDDRWAHVICGLWVPEVMFANLTFLEPLEGIDKIAPARWRLQCFICKQRNVGACIQCHKTSCYRAFHVTCAQHAGLYMKIEHTDDQGDAGIRKSAFCDHHCPPNHFANANKGMYANSDSESPQSPEQVARIKLRKARKVLAERRNSKPSVCVPIVPKSKIELIGSRLDNVSGEVMAFLQKAYAFWKLKREFRRGVPLLKRLQASSVHRNAATFAAAVDSEAQQMRAQLKFWQQLRQDLEKARLLAELTRKRERVKRDMFRLFVSEIELQIQPLNTFLSRLLEQLQELDKQNIFAEPVGPDLAPDYHLIIKHPMDFSTMRKKIAESSYTSMESFTADFEQMLDNCFQYNRRDSIYCTAATRLAEQGKKIFQEATSVARASGLCLKTGLWYIEQQDVAESASRDPSATDDTIQVKENYLHPIPVDKIISSGEADQTKTNLTRLSVTTVDDENCNDGTSSPIHLPLKELANRPEQVPVASTTRSRLRISAPVQELGVKRSKIRIPNGFINLSGDLPRRSRKRRIPSGSPGNKFSPDDVRPPKRLEGPHSPRNLLYWQSQSRALDLFASRVPVTAANAAGTTNSNNALANRTVGSRWSSSAPPDASNWLLSRGSDGIRNRNGLQFSTVINEQLNGISTSTTQNGPAFTNYRLSRPSRGEDDEDDEDEEEDETEEESEELDEDGQAVHNNTAHPSNLLNSSDALAHGDASRTTRRQLRGRGDTGITAAGERSSLVVTTVVGNSRMATLARRTDHPRIKRKPAVVTLRSVNVHRARSDNPLVHRRQINRPAPVKRSYSRNPIVLRRRVPSCSSSTNSAQPNSSIPAEDDLRKPLQLREVTSSSLTLDYSDALSHLESPGPLSATTSLEPYEFSNHSADMSLSAAGSPTVRGGRAGDPLYEHQFGPLDVVWAKCRGSPWYPALVVDPAAREGYCHNGVPVPVPPESVLNWGKRLDTGNHTDREKPNLLVLFFDTKRTWQWLSQPKLQLLGYNSDLDRERLKEGKRSKLKHSVFKAYRRAVEHLCKVHGKPYPYADGTKSAHDLAVFTL